MVALVQWFNASGLTQAAAAKTLGVTQPRLNQLLKGKIETSHGFDGRHAPGPAAWML